MRLAKLSVLALLVFAAGCGDEENRSQSFTVASGGSTGTATNTKAGPSGGAGGSATNKAGSGGNGGGTTGTLSSSTGGASGGASNSTGGNASGGTQTILTSVPTGGKASAGGSAALGGTSSAVATTTSPALGTGGTQPLASTPSSSGNASGGSTAVLSSTFSTGGIGTGGNPAGGTNATGGMSAATGGMSAATGGTSAATGGANASGGSTAESGGTTASISLSATGGTSASGGTESGGTGSSSSATGGSTGTGGSVATGGTSSSTCTSGIVVNGDCWTCEASAYDANDDVCDCGCGVHDPDCDDVVGQPFAHPYCLDASWVECCTTYTRPGSCVPTNNVAPLDALDLVNVDNSKCGPVPTGWTCDFLEYADAICNCGCGVSDQSDCNGTSSGACDQWNSPGACSSNSGSDVLSPNDNAVCNADVPARWTCDRALYQDGTCDCGCGARDADCSAADATVCARCDGKGSCAEPNGLDCSVISNDNNAFCSNGTWTCYLGMGAPGDGICDCGCGMEDPDCRLQPHLLAECANCGLPGSCAKTCDDIDATDISTCRRD
jgi:hypothetical protein